MNIREHVRGLAATGKSTSRWKISPDKWVEIRLAEEHTGDMVIDGAQPYCAGFPVDIVPGTNLMMLQ